ncbi:unnamed protein product [Mycena citricolor]|uniref:Uncharacterized protein n=1 Tax=Mycena citricolor TaxID=2018698 RepID=A0AAD2Q2E2_9AGAR|nr:unnamed protein product [Mycena citricolor]
MCQQEYHGNLYRGCGCFDVIYRGDRLDCMQPDCRASMAHAHQGYCRCPQAMITESRRIINLFRPMCDQHRVEQWDATRGRGR